LTNINPLHHLDSRYNSIFENIRWHCTSVAEIRKIIKSLKTKSSYGYDKISTKMLKVSMPYIISPLTYICNESLAQGIFPDRLKFARVKPILNNGGKCEPPNYRCTSLLSSFSKVFERLIYNQLFEHININNILDNNQYGFRPNSSTENASFKLIDEILKSINNKQLAGGIFCDLQKAFDCVSHDILIKKLEFYGITGKFGALIKSYLRGRYQRVNLDTNNSKNSFSSRWAEIKSGVPQGSILVPLVFLLYINDITKVSNKGVTIFLYADDTSIIVTKHEYNGYRLAMNKIFCKVNTCFEANLLTLQLSTTNHDELDMCISFSHKQFVNSSSTKFLGLNIDNKLSCKNHIDYLVTKLSSSCFIMRTIKPIVSKEFEDDLLCLHSVMTYGIIFWR
jgi:hypothetical protein